MATAPATSTALATLTRTLAKRLDMGEGEGLIDVLKATAFKGQVTDAQMTALMVVANQYGLNPWTKEIYAFPDKNNGIVPVVGLDGWARIINSHPQFDGMEFQQDEKSCTCIMYRKDRSRPTSITEYMGECKRATAPWSSHPMRMLRHKAMIQCARLTFGFGGIYDDDEAARIIDMGDADVVGGNAPITMPKPKAAAAPQAAQAEASKVAPAAKREAAQEAPAATRQQTTIDAETGEVLDDQPTGDAPAASKGFLAHVLAKAAELGVEENTIWEHFGITSLDGLQQPKAAEILVWIKAQ